MVRCTSLLFSRVTRAATGAASILKTRTPTGLQSPKGTASCRRIRAFLEEDFSVQSLPSVEEAEKLVAAHRKVIEQTVSEDRYADTLEELKQSQLEPARR